MSGLFAGTPLERPVTCEVCEKPLDLCTCPRDAAGKVRLPSSQNLRIRREKRRNGKVVTVISGLDPDASDLKAIVKSLRTTCGAGGTVTSDGIEVQGDHRAAAQELLVGMEYRVVISD